MPTAINTEKFMNEFRELNDRLRKFGGHSSFRVSRGLLALGYDHYVRLRQAVIDYDNFSPENDPWGYHDKGFIELDGNSFIWAMHYQFEWERNDDAYLREWNDPKRQLTIMRAQEY